MTEYIYIALSDLVFNCDMFYFLTQIDPSGIRHIDPLKKEISYNPKYEELYAPQVTSYSIIGFPIQAIELSAIFADSSYFSMNLTFFSLFQLFFHFRF